MSCSDRRNAIMRDLTRVEVLAQKVADLHNAPQVIYKTICDGAQIYKFSSDWKGEAVKTVYPSGQHSSEDILRDNEHIGLESTEPTGRKSKRRRAEENLEQSSGSVLQEEQ